MYPKFQLLVPFMCKVSVIPHVMIRKTKRNGCTSLCVLFELSGLSSEQGRSSLYDDSGGGRGGVLVKVTVT